MHHHNLLSRTMSGAILAISLVTVPGPGNAAAPQDPSGTWLTEDGRGRIRVERCGSKPEQICGYVVWMKEPNDEAGKPRKDQSNPDRAKRSRVLLGHQLILGLKANADERFGGQIYNADNGKKYDITLWRDAPDALKIKGCMMSVFCGSQTWNQTTDILPGQLVAPTGSPNGPRADPEWVQETVTKHSTTPKPTQ